MKSDTVMTEYEKFDGAMDALLKVNPSVVKAAMDQEKREREEERKVKRASSASAPVSSTHDA